MGSPLPMYEPLEFWYHICNSRAYAGTYSRRFLLLAKGCPSRGRSPICLALLQAYILRHNKHLFRRRWSCRSRSNRAFPGQDSPCRAFFTITAVHNILRLICQKHVECVAFHLKNATLFHVENCPFYFLQLLCQYWCHLGGLFSA